MFIPFQYEASSDPTGPAFEGRKIIEDKFLQPTYTVPYLVEAKGKDILTQKCLSELYQNEEGFRGSSNHEKYQFSGYDPLLDQQITTIYSFADGVQIALLSLFQTPLSNATEDMVKVALHYFILQAPDFKFLFSTDNHTNIQNIIIGPMTFNNITVWQTKAFISLVYLDYEKVHDNLTDVLDREKLNLDVIKHLKGDERNFKLYGIAIDFNTEIQKEGQTSIILVIVAVIVILIIVYISLRSGQETVLVGLAILMLLFWLNGCVKLLNFGSSQYIELLLPIAILSLGVDYAIHSIHRYHEERKSEPNPKKAYEYSMSMVGAALFLAMVTTAVAFFSNASSELQSVQQFGLAAGLAIISAFILLGLFVPAIRMMFEQRKFDRAQRIDKNKTSEDSDNRGLENKTKNKEKVNKKETSNDIPNKISNSSSENLPENASDISSKTRKTKASDRIWSGVAKLGKKPFLVIIIVILITIPLVYRGLQIEGKMPVEDFINPNSQFVISLKKMEKYFNTGEEGKVLIQGDFSNPEVLLAIRSFQENLSDNKEAVPPGNIVCIYDYVYNITTNGFIFQQYGNTTLRDYLGISDTDGDGIPDNADMLDRIYEFIIVEKQGVPLYHNGNILVKFSYLDVRAGFKWSQGDNLDLVVLTARLPHSGEASKIKVARSELENDLKALESLGFERNKVTDGKYYIITDVGVYNPFTREEQMTALTNSMAASIFISIILCLIVLVILFKSVKFGMVTIIPVCLVVAWLYGFMELTGYYLNSVTVTIAAISIGVGVDYSIHVTQRFREEMEKANDFQPAMHSTLKNTGKALLASAGSTFVGFVIIGFSPMTMFSKFGILTAIMIGMAFISAIFVLPAFLALITRPKSK
jgi:predicted RND superfamily exporter protein